MKLSAAHLAAWIIEYQATAFWNTCGLYEQILLSIAGFNFNGGPLAPGQ